MKVFIELDIQTFKHDQSRITRADEYFASVIKKISETGKGVKIVRINAVDEHINGDGSISQIAEMVKESLPEKIVEGNNNEVKA